jgi:hypothetical protein
MLRSTTSAVEKLGVALAYVCGMAALVVILLRIGVLLELVTVGPLLPGKSLGVAIHHAFESVGLGGLIAGDLGLLAALVLMSSGAVLAWRLRLRHRQHASAIVLQLAIGLAVLAYSYRLVGFLGVLCVIGWQLVRRRVGWPGWLLWAVALGVCFAPYDVTCRNIEGPAHLETNIHCATEAAAADYAANRRVCVGSDAAIYYEPTAVWVW